MSGKWAPLRFKSTWREYRYGSNKKPVTLAPILKGKARENAIDGTVAHLRLWRLSPYEQEAATRVGIRSALCLAGYGWELSDMEAAALVKAGLHRMGARRPTWDEGQWQYSHPRENCYRCNRLLDDEDRARGFRYCSDVCARATRQHFSDELPWDHELRRSAYWQSVIHNSPVLTCKTCGEKFKTRARATKSRPDGPQYCSPKCLPQRQRTLEPKPCKWCKELFQPKGAAKVYCSMACRDAFRVDEWRRTLPEKTCPACKTIFRPGSPKGLYCSDRCWKDVKNARRRAEWVANRGKGFREAAE